MPAARGSTRLTSPSARKRHTSGARRVRTSCIDNPRLRAAIGDNEFFFENEDGRIVLIFPLGDKVLIGTSDIRIEDPDQAVITDDEVHAFIDMVGRVFPTIDVNPSQIVYTFSGVRPLAYSDANLTGQISRDHQIKVIEPGAGCQLPGIFAGGWEVDHVPGFLRSCQRPGFRPPGCAAQVSAPGSTRSGVERVPEDEGRA